MSQPVLPQPDRDSSLWWEALDKRELQVQQCDTCGRLRWPARALCNVCHHVDATWVPVSGRGRVVSWTVNHRAAPGVPVPYVVLLVRLDEQSDIHIPGFFDGPADGTGLTLGASVIAGFEKVTDHNGEATLLRWRLALPTSQPN